MELVDARILIVDDEEALCKIFARWLSTTGCSVQTAAHGAEALQIIASSEIDVLVTDIHMPVMDGITLVRQPAEMGRRIPSIIFVSAFGNVDLREMHDLGAEAFLTKPFRTEELEAALRSALAPRRALWKEPLPQTPHNSAQLTGVWDPSTGPPGVQPEPIFRLGRGGFRAQAENVVVLGKVALRCRVTHPSGALIVELNGQGIVRWRSRTDAAVGIAFVYLDEPGRAWVVERLEAAMPRAFIPA
jgi:CheY-like chemotaxis protein